MPKKTSKPNENLRALPSIDTLLKTETGVALGAVMGLEQLTNLARKVTDELRQEILAGQFDGDGDNLSQALQSEAERRLRQGHEHESARGLRRVINATGVILHTNLGRAPLSNAAQRAMVETAAGYCSLEYDLNSGRRGRRGARVEDLLSSLCGAEAALVVNNCAAAALLVLTVFARGGEAIVSRGELVEIGGDFRVPDIMAESGTRMIEVGTTNRTKLADYRKAISDNTRLILRVHTSNYRIVGFTEAPILEELALLAHETGLLIYEDAGSGALIDFNSYGISGEPVVRESFAAGADVISFSGDKLLGGPQAGLLVGRSEIIERMRTHPLYRSLRADKFRIAALEATLDSYARGEASSEIPTHQLISLSFAEMKTRAEQFVATLQEKKLSARLRVEIIEGESAIGGGAAPTSRLKTALISLRHDDLTANQVEALLRHSQPPIIARIEDDRVLLDLRTVLHGDVSPVADAVLNLPN
ncbi:MAG TPA: L-seryl-tRNA(Sec) selenium transferase [Pyrinomonadaceae bacterium]|nr:L-seryl-tRNA(Sec) selenium transferase [Pyrinomonadaceae bacterium]